MMAASRNSAIGGRGRAEGSDEAPTWTFLSNHAHVLVCIARDPDSTLRGIAEHVGVTERAVHRIVTELEAAGAITRVREGRRNHYEIATDTPLRHPLEAERTIGDLLAALLSRDAAAALGLRSSKRRSA